MSNNLICFGDVVKIASKSGFVDASDPSAAADTSDTFLGFLEQKKELLLVVPPVKEDLLSHFKEAEFIVSAIRGDKPPAPGTPLSYKQPFVLKTSDGSGYSLNNKTPNMSEAVSLRECSVKGEMYLAVHKEGFSDDAHVHDGDMNVELMIVDSNRIRKTYNNKPLTHVTRAKSDTPGGVVSCSAKGRVLTFKLVKIADKTETRTFVKDPVFRRASQMLLDPVKADETSEASVLESPSRAGSIVGTTTGALVSEDALSSAPSSPKKHAAPEMDAPMTSIPEGAAASETSAEVAAATQPVVETPVLVAAAATATTTTASSAGGVSPAELTTQLQSIVLAEKKVEEKTKTAAVPETAGPIVAETVEPLTDLATIELSAASAPDMDAMDGSAPVHDKFNLAPAPASPSSTQPKTKTSTPKAAAAPASQISEIETFEGPAGLPTGSDEQVDTACVGKCAIM